MEITHVVASLDFEASGLTPAVSGLTAALARQGHRVAVHVLEPGPHRDITDVQVVTHPQWRFPQPIGVSCALWRSLKEHARSADVLHSHSLWTFPAIAPGFLVGPGRAKLIASPHGTLSPWALNQAKWKKRVVWWLAQSRALERADCLHATAESEAEDFRRLGLRKPIAVIPLGIEVAEPSPPVVAATGEQCALSLGRLHPIKALDRLITAWAWLEVRHPRWRLVIAGGDEMAPGYRVELEGLVNRLGCRSITFAGPVYGEAKTALYRQSALFLLPSHSENFGIVVVEALREGVPVIASKRTPWAGLEKEGCGWWTDHDVDTLAACLDQALALDPASLAEMGGRGREWVRRDFGWDGITERMSAVYGWLINGGPRPRYLHVA